MKNKGKRKGEQGKTGDKIQITAGKLEGKWLRG